MKKLIIIIIAFVAPMAVMQAQDKITDQDYVIFQDGEVLQYTDGIPKQLTDAVTLNNGTVVNANGTYEMKGKKAQLKDGECLGMSGHKYKSETQLFQKVQAEKKKLLKKGKLK